MAGGLQANANPDDRTKLRRRWIGFLARVVVFGVLLTWFALYGDLEAFASTLARVRPGALLSASAFALGVLVIGGVRWRVLMDAFAPSDPPTMLATIRLFFVGFFYNTFVPGSVGGDIVRGVLTRRCFDRKAASYLVVLLERLIGFSALGFVFVLGLAVGPDIVGLGGQRRWLAIPLTLGLGALGVAMLSGRLSRTVAMLPDLKRKQNIVWVFVLSLLSHLCGITATWLLGRGMGLPIGLDALLIVMPIAFTAAVMPINVLGMGAREVSLVALLGQLGVEAEQALALSLAYGVIFLVLAAAGGLLQLVQGRVRAGGATGALTPPRTGRRPSRPSGP